MPAAAIYARVSTTEQAEQNISIPAQKSRLTSYCDSRGWDVFDFYIDDGYSGKDLDRPEMARLIKDAGNKQFDCVLVWKLDRISRRQQHVMYLLEEVFMPNNIEFASVTENFDTSTPMGRAMLGIMAVFGQLERETIIERVTMAKAEAAKQGRWMGGVVTFGYNHDPAAKSLTINEVEAEIVKRIFTEYCKGDRGFRYITDLLNDNKVPALGNTGRWYKEAVMRIIRNPVYAGYLQHNGDLFKGNHTPLISEELWEEAQKLLSSKRKRLKPGNGSNNVGLLKGITYCGECRNKVRLKPAGNSKYRRLYYTCYSRDRATASRLNDPDCTNGHHRHEDIENKVIEKLMRYSDNPKALQKDIQKELLNKAPDNYEKLIKSASRELEDTKKKLRKWQDAFEIDAITLDEMRERTSALEQRRLYLESRLTECRNEQQKAIDYSVAADNLIMLISNFPTIWNEATDQERRQLILELVERVWIYKDGFVELDFFST